MNYKTFGHIQLNVISFIEEAYEYNSLQDLKDRGRETDYLIF